MGEEFLTKNILLRTYSRLKCDITNPLGIMYKTIYCKGYQ